MGVGVARKDEEQQGRVGREAGTRYEPPAPEKDRRIVLRSRPTTRCRDTRGQRRQHHIALHDSNRGIDRNDSTTLDKILLPRRSILQRSFDSYLRINIDSIRLVHKIDSSRAGIVSCVLVQHSLRLDNPHNVESLPVVYTTLSLELAEELIGFISRGEIGQDGRGRRHGGGVTKAGEKRLLNVVNW